MSKRAKYLVKIHQKINNDDLPLLPNQLKKDFPFYQQILAIDPYDTCNLPSHNLIGKLINCRALEIDWNGMVYRLVYKIYDSPPPKRVLILSFDQHDPAYNKAKKRK
jgi:hypothetical protein